MPVRDDVDVSFDKLSVVGSCSDPRDFQRWMTHHSQDVGSVRELPQMSGTAPWGRWLRRAWQSDDGVNVQLRLKVPDARLLVEDWSQSVEDTAAFRLEWNPNKADARAYLMWMEEPRATRTDIALDYEGCDLNDWVFQRPRVAVSRFSDQRGAQTGMQLGRTKSPRFTVVYDKAAELAIQYRRESGLNVTPWDDIDLMRFEMRNRLGPTDEPLQPSLFDGVRAISTDIPSSVSPSEAAYLALMVHCPAHFGRLDRHTQAKYRELSYSRVSELEPHPEEVYRGLRNELKEGLCSLLAGEAWKVARVYELAPDPEDLCVSVSCGGSEE